MRTYSNRYTTLIAIDTIGSQYLKGTLQQSLLSSSRLPTITRKLSENAKRHTTKIDVSIPYSTFMLCTLSRVPFGCTIFRSSLFLISFVHHKRSSEYCHFLATSRRSMKVSLLLTTTVFAFATLFHACSAALCPLTSEGFSGLDTEYSLTELGKLSVLDFSTTVTYATLPAGMCVIMRYGSSSCLFMD